MTQKEYRLVGMCLFLNNKFFMENKLKRLILGVCIIIIGSELYDQNNWEFYFIGLGVGFWMSFFNKE